MTMTVLMLTTFATKRHRNVSQNQNVTSTIFPMRVMTKILESRKTKVRTDPPPLIFTLEKSKKNFLITDNCLVLPPYFKH